MNRQLLDNPRVYPKVILWWKGPNGETELKLHNRTLAQAYDVALRFGYEPPKWYKPWQYFWGGLGVVTVG